MTAYELYAGSVRAWPRGERLRLAALILEDLANEPELSLVESEWTDEDLRDMTAYTMAYAAQRYPETEDLV